MITETARGIVPRVIERIDDERRKRALRRLRAGRSVPEIAQELGVSEAWVRKLGAGKVAARPVGRPPGTSRAPSAAVVKAKRETVALHKKGRSPQQIAEALGRSSRTIYLYLQEARDEGLIK